MLSNDALDVFPTVRSLDVGSEGELRMWFSPISTLYKEAMGLYSVSLGEYLGIEGRWRKLPGEEIGRWEDGKTY